MQTKTLDVLIQNAWIIDGTGEPRWQGDVGIADGRIHAIGSRLHEQFQAKEVIDATGAVVCPGFIDTHGHDDLMFVERPDLAWKTTQGVTSVVVGNCGISAAPAPLPGHSAAALALMGETPLFDSFGAYFSQIKSIKPMINVAALVGHANLRLAAMADPVSAQPSESEMQAMESLLEQALEQGAIGMSTGLAYSPGGHAGFEELRRLCAVLARHGAVHTSHIRNEADRVQESVKEIMDLGKATGCSSIVSHHKCMMPQNWGRSVETLAMIDENRDSGVPVAMDVYPYNASSTILIADRAELIDEIRITWSKTHPEQAGRMLADIARDWGCSRTEAAQRLSPAGAIYFAMSEEDVQRILKHPCCMVGSDGLPNDSDPHPRLWGTFTKVLGQYVRQCQLLTLEEAVAKMTSLPASVFRFKDRGVLKEGAHADVVLFDPDNVRDRATWDQPTLPSEGILRVWINGVSVLPGDATIERPGQILHRDPVAVA